MHYKILANIIRRPLTIIERAETETEKEVAKVFYKNDINTPDELKLFIKDLGYKARTNVNLRRAFLLTIVVAGCSTFEIVGAIIIFILFTLLPNTRKLISPKEVLDTKDSFFNKGIGNQK
ncbi:MAG: hypothetical protein ABIH39_05220 [Candidatus Margulisiibacteriota bacterium]